MKSSWKAPHGAPVDPTVDRTSFAQPSVSTEVRRYHVVEALGRGGFGTVYKAELLGTGGFTKTVALKVLNASVAEAEGIAERLRDEARMLGLLRHRAIVRVDGLHLLNGRWTVVMEFVEGVDLKRLLTAGPTPVGAALEIVEEVASALYTAYDRPNDGGHPLRLLHRDIKPSNIQLTPVGEVKVLDFGVARAEFENREAETRSLYFGSLDYMSPERMDGIDTHRGDIFAVGSVLYELIVGEQLRRTSGNRERHDVKVEAALDKLWEVEQDEDLTHLVADCLAYDHRSRPDARSLERRAHKLRQRYPEPWLREWAELRVPHLLAHRKRLDDELSGAILVEESGLSSSMPTSESGPMQSTGSSASSLVRPRHGRSSGIWLAVGTVVGLGAVLALGGSLLLGGWWFSQGLTEAGVDAPPSPDGLSPSEAPTAEPAEVAETAATSVPEEGSDARPAAPEVAAREGAAAPSAAPPGAGTGGAPAGEPPSSTPPASAPSTPATSASSAPAATASTPSASTPSASTPSASTSSASAHAPSEPPAEQVPTSPVDPAMSGKVLVQGDASRVRLVGPPGRFPPGAVPPGTYEIQASFGGAPYESAGEVTVQQGRAVTLYCKSAFGRCVVR